MKSTPAWKPRFSRKSWLPEAEAEAGFQPNPALQSPNLAPLYFFLFGAQDRSSTLQGRPGEFYGAKDEIEDAVRGVSREACAREQWRLPNAVSSCVRPENEGMRKQLNVLRRQTTISQQAKVIRANLEIMPVLFASNMFSRKYAENKCGTNFWDTRYVGSRRAIEARTSLISLPEPSPRKQTFQT